MIAPAQRCPWTFTEGFLFAVKDGAVVVTGGQSEDATGFAVAALAGGAGAVVAEYSLKLLDLFAAEEVFIAGTACGVIGIVRMIGVETQTDWSAVMATAVLALLPPVFVVVLMQRWFVAGLTEGEK